MLFRSAMAIGFYYLSSLAPRIPMDLVAPTLQAGTIDTSAATSEDLGGVTLLDLQRLEGLRHIGMLEELVNDYPPEIARLVARLERDVAGNDMPRSLETLHSLLGMSGEAGTAALYQMVRRVYVPMVENRHWPVDAGWLAQLKSLSVATGEALRAHSAAQTRTHSM